MSTPDILTPPVHANDARWDIVLRVAASAGFQRSPRLRELLLYICERAILNRPEELREQQIGCGVFGRKPDYSPGEDNIVRVEMRHLRKRLEEYFLSEGKDEPVVIVVPKGAYVPSFELREVVYPPPIATRPPEPALAPVSAPPLQPAPLMPPPERRNWISLQTVVIVLLASACLALWQQNRIGANHAVMAASAGAASAELWPLVFNQRHPTYIVCADSTLVLAQLLLHRRVRLPEFLSGEYASVKANDLPSESAILRRLPRWQFTDMADLRLVQRLSAANPNRWGNVTIHSAKTTEIQDFKNGNIVMLGSNRSNPWNELFEPALNFVFDFDEDSQTPLVRNKAPQAGEQPEYRAASPGVAGVAYSTVALIPNLRHTGNVIIIAGTTGEATEATGEFLTDPKASATFCAMLRRNRSRMPYFEALLRSNTLAGIAKSTEVVAVRILSGDPAGV
jgi:hypothetical protein